LKNDLLFLKEESSFKQIKLKIFSNKYCRFNNCITFAVLFEKRFIVLRGKFFELMKIESKD